MCRAGELRYGRWEIAGGRPGCTIVLGSFEYEYEGDAIGKSSAKSNTS